MIQQFLETQIVTTEGMSHDQALHLIKQMECADLALARFLKGEISFSDYCDILELCEVNIDSYLINVEENLATVGIF
ncbi:MULTISPECIES: hypothetical protein [unclassified Nostoc]|uniref:hypothetical protein n=1 Tax=unclassified Nostoc TaxID=2593658 RepID=UPI002AD2C546|nr:hypothetical protein [Nostoc sp. DedQUE03]MDZ7977220.1 hypothetical protein [Nostoc sp. DedQUE03]MDZ8047659.1 hypothetical protein [Nostoc sp. DedQUE02]